jgi:hypothetical protein
MRSLFGSGHPLVVMCWLEAILEVRCDADLL